MTKKISLIFFLISIFSCEKDNINSETFSLNIEITNNIPITDDSYNYGWVDNDLSTYDVEIFAEAYTTSGYAELNNNLDLVSGGYLDAFGLHENETILINHDVQLDVGSVVLITIQAWNENTSFWVNNNDTVHVELLDYNTHLSNYDIQGATGTNPVIEEDNSDLIGKWVLLSGCSNLNNEHIYFKFNSDGSGYIFNADCNNLCVGYGYYLYFDWEDNGNSVDLNYTSASDYCGVETATPNPETLNYTISGNQLTIGGGILTKE